ncbi:DUF86 domain-containing protein [Candidatus Dojkabacteria bacterium]|nr:DUF86 domain-containing protein [Candidatus Dojkabacteria bacterium]
MRFQFMKKTVRHLIADLKEYGERITDITNELTEEEFSQNNLAQDALLRRISVIGIIVKRLPKKFTERYPDIPWSAAAKTRDRLAHHYEGTDMSLVWEIATVDIPNFVKKIDQLDLADQKALEYED